MSLAALGANPEHTWTVSNNVVGGSNPNSAARLGTLAYSPDGGLYVCVQATEAIDAYRLCLMSPGNMIALGDQGDGVGGSYCIPQGDIPNGARGWALIAGNGLVGATNAAVAASNAGTVSGTGGRVVTGSATDRILGLMYAADSGTAVRDIPCTVFFPKKDT